MAYHINEGSLGIGAFLHDRTVNVVTVETPEIGQAQIILSRDELQNAESLTDSVNRQLKTLQQQVKKFINHGQKDIKVGNNQWPAICVHTEFSQGAQTVHQVQIAAQTTDKKVLVFTFSAMRTLPEGLVNQWVSLVEAFEARS